MKKALLFLIFTTVLLSCSEDSSEKEVPQPEAKEETEEIFELLNFELEVEVFEDGGVMLEASATNIDTAEVSEQGFLLSQFENPDFNNSQKFESNEIQGKKFLLTIDKDLDFNKEYFIVAYVKIGETYEYTTIKSFVSTGSKAPVISQIDQAHIGDTLQIKGSNFSSIPNKIKVLFDDEISAVLESSDTLVKCIVPETLKRFNPKVTLELYNKSDSFEDFSLFTPIIEEISKEVVSIGDTLTVYGKHFDFENLRNSIFIEEKHSEVLFSSRDSIVFVIPQSLSKSTNSFALLSQLQSTDSELNFTVKSPSIAEIPQSFRSYEIIEIIGDEFSPIALDNIVLFDSQQATVLEASKNRLKVRVPLGPYNDKNLVLQIKLMDYVYQFEGDLEFIDTWLLYKELPENYFQHFVSKDDVAYVFVEDDVNARFVVKRLDSDLNLLSTFHVPYPRTTIRDEYFRILYNQMTDRVFFYFTEDEEDNFYEFSLVSLEFETRAHYPDSQINGNTIFSIQDKLYMGFGTFTDGVNPSENPLPYAQIWEYDIGNDNWNQIANFPIEYRFRTTSTTFVIDNEAYVGNGATSTGGYKFWKYSPLNNEWARTDNFPDARRNNAYFEYNNNGYVVFGNTIGGSYRDQVFKYVPSADDWFELERINEFYYNLYGLSHAPSKALKFSNSIYLLVDKYPNSLCFKADLNKL